MHLRGMSTVSSILIMRRGVSLAPKSAVNGGGTVTNRRLVTQGQSEAYSTIPDGGLGEGEGTEEGMRGQREGEESHATLGYAL